MGTCLCKSADDDNNNKQSQQQQQKARSVSQQHNHNHNNHNNHNHNNAPRHPLLLQTPSVQSKVSSSSKGVGLGISMMMYQAGMLAGCAPPPNLIDINNLRAQMRKAKAEGRTVSVLNGCVYIDYQLKAQIPPGCKMEF